ncbi:MAG: DUF444 family protein, partial [Patescibacteria group bacterium]
MGFLIYIILRLQFFGRNYKIYAVLQNFGLGRRQTMAIINSDSVGERGKKDARRHREKQKETIKEHLPEIISEEAIITSKGKRIVKIPIRGIEIPTFRPAQNGEESYGIGQGNGDGDGVAGDKPGIDYIETEVELEELIEMDSTVFEEYCNKR